MTAVFLFLSLVIPPVDGTTSEAFAIAFRELGEMADMPKHGSVFK
jgi:hypothetical protein